MSKLISMMTIILTWLQYLLWFGKNGIQDYNRINTEILQQKIVNAKLKEQNKQIIIEINDFNDNQEAIEEHARSDLNMIKPGENFYRLVLNTSKTTHESIQNNQYTKQKITK